MRFVVVVLVVVLVRLSPAALATVTLAMKVRAACAQLGINCADMPVPTALRACNEAAGIEPRGPLLSQAEELSVQLGLTFETLPLSSPSPVACQTPAASPPLPRRRRLPDGMPSRASPALELGAFASALADADVP